MGPPKDLKGSQATEAYITPYTRQEGRGLGIQRGRKKAIHERERLRVALLYIHVS